MQAGWEDGGNLHGVLLVRLQLPARHRHGANADGLDKYVRRRGGVLGRVDLDDARATARLHQPPKHSRGDHGTLSSPDIRSESAVREQASVDGRARGGLVRGYAEVTDLLWLVACVLFVFFLSFFAA